MTADRRTRLVESPLYLVSTLTPDASTDLAMHALIAATDAGAALIQLRVKDVGTAERRNWMRRCRDALEPHVLLIVNDDLDAAFDEDGHPLADGVHLGRTDAAALGGLAAARSRLGADLLLGTSTRELSEVAAAREAGADYVGFGAMSVSPTKHDTHPADPAELARCIAAHPEFPIFPIGGLGPDNLGLVLDAGCRRAAIGSAILDSDDAADATAECLERLGAD